MKVGGRGKHRSREEDRRRRRRIHIQLKIFGIFQEQQQKKHQDHKINRASQNFSGHLLL